MPAGSDRGDISVDLAMTNFIAAIFNPSYAALEFYPEVRVGFNENTYFQYDKSHLVVPDDALRVDGAESGAVRRKTSKLTFETDEYALHEQVTYKQMKKASYPLRPLNSAARRLKEQLLLKREYDTHAEALADLTTGGFVMAVANEWNTAAGTPITDIKDTAITSIVANSLHLPNKIGLPIAVQLAMSLNAEVLAIQAGISQEAKTTWGIINPLAGMDVVTLGAHYLSSNIGQTVETIAAIWGEDVLLAYVEENPDLEAISLGYNFMAPDPMSDLYDFQVLNIDEPKQKSRRVEVSVQLVQKTVCAGAGYMFTSTLT